MKCINFLNSIPFQKQTKSKICVPRINPTQPELHWGREITSRACSVFLSFIQVWVHWPAIQVTLGVRLGIESHPESHVG